MQNLQDLRVALVAHRFPPAVGGVERHVAELARGFVRRGMRVEVVTCDPTGKLPAEACEEGITIHRFPTVAHDGVFYTHLRWACGCCAMRGVSICCMPTLTIRRWRPKA